MTREQADRDMAHAAGALFTFAFACWSLKAAAAWVILSFIYAVVTRART